MNRTHQSLFPLREICITLMVFSPFIQLPFCFILVHVDNTYGRLLETVTDSVYKIVFQGKGKEGSLG